MQAYTTKSGATRYKPNLDAVMAAVQEDAMSGFCLACGQEGGPIEPDGERAECLSCGESFLFGAEQLLLRGIYHE